MDVLSLPTGLEGHQTLAEPKEKSPVIPGASQHSAIFSTYPASIHDDLLSFLSYIKSRRIPILSVAIPDVCSVLGSLMYAQFLAVGHHS